MSGRIWEYLQCAAVLTGDLIICAMLIEMAPLLLGFSLAYRPWAWLLVLALQLLISLVILHHGTSWTVYIIVQAAAIAAEVALSCFMFVSTEYIMEFRECFGIVAASVGLHAAYAAYRHPSANLCVGYVDVTVGILIFYMYVEYETGRSEPVFWLFAVLSVLLDLAVVSHLRTEAENGHRISGAGALGKGVLIALPLIFLIVTAVAVGSGASQIRSFADLILLAAQKAGSVIYVVTEAIVYVLAAIIAFIIRILPNTPSYLQDPTPPVMEAVSDGGFETAGSLPSWIFALIFGMIAAALIIWVLYMLKGTHIRLNTMRAKNRRVERKSYFLPAIFDLFKRVREYLSFEWDYLRNRRTPQGLYLLARRRGERIKVKKKESESPSAYLRRLRGRLEDAQLPADTCTALSDLAGILDDIFYGGKSVKLKKDEYAGYVRLIRDIPRL